MGDQFLGSDQSATGRKHHRVAGGAELAKRQATVLVGLRPVSEPDLEESQEHVRKTDAPVVPYLLGLFGASSNSCRPSSSRRPLVTRSGPMAARMSCSP